jgi:hypothetical protein
MYPISFRPWRKAATDGAQSLGEAAWRKPMTGIAARCARAESGTRPPPQKSRPIDPVFRADSVVLAISAEKDGNCGWSTLGSDAAKVVLPGEVLKLRWRGSTPPLRVTLG